METYSRGKTIHKLMLDIGKGEIKFNHKLQRAEGVWNPKQKSLIVDSLLREYPINPVYVAREDDGVYILDGVQRVSSVRDYINNKFALSKDLKPLIIKVTNENDEIEEKEFEIAGKRFKKLDKSIQELLKAAELPFFYISNHTQEDIREVFRRQNFGKPLSAKQTRVISESDRFMKNIYELSSLPLMNKICTKAQKKNSTDKDLIIQTLMLIETNGENDYTSFRSADIDNFIIMCQDEIDDDVFILLSEAIERLDEAFPEKININISSIPMMLYASYVVHKNKKSFSRLVEIINKFLIEYDNNEEYKKFVQSGTASSENVRNRWNYWKEMIKSA